MISIAICDDNLSAVSEIERVLEQIPHQTILFDAFYSGEELLKYVLYSHEYYDIYLLDIEMKSVNGLEVAKQINLFSPNSLIVFITSYEKYIYEAFDALAFNFIKKPIDNQRFQAIIEKAICFIEANKKKFCFTQNNSKKSILCSDIYYFESEKRKMIVYCVTQTFCFYSSVKQVLEQLDSTIFNQTHASYIVNMNFIDTIYREHLLLTNGKEIPISKKYKKSLMDGYHFFLRRRL